MSYFKLMLLTKNVAYQNVLYFFCKFKQKIYRFFKRKIMTIYKFKINFLL